MVSIGGTVALPSFSDEDPTNYFDGGNVDPCEQGIDIFDLSAFEWKDSFDANAAPYVTPDIVKAHYRDNDMENFVWDSETVKERFGFSKRSDTANSTQASSSEVSDVGAIAGGVVGGVAGIAALCALLFFLRRHRRRNRDVVAGSGKMDYPEGELRGQDRFVELAGRNRPHESGGAAVYELRGNPEPVIPASLLLAPSIPPN